MGDNSKVLQLGAVLDAINDGDLVNGTRDVGNNLMIEFQNAADKFFLKLQFLNNFKSFENIFCFSKRFFQFQNCSKNKA